MTGYRPVCPLGVLGSARSLCAVDEDGMVRIRRDFRARASCAMHAGIYLQGPTEHTHGIGSTLLSTRRSAPARSSRRSCATTLARADEALVGAGERS